MTVSLPDPMTLPVHRTCPFDPPDEYAHLRAGRPFSRLVLPGGRVGWLVTRYEDVRATLADPRFSPPLIQVTPKTELPLPEDELTVPPGTFSALDPPEQSRYRRLVSRHFTRKRMREHAPRIQQLVDEHLTAMIEGGSPADLISQFAEPVPTAVITELLGVPERDRADYQHWISTMLSLTAESSELRAAQASIYASLAGLVRAKHDQPGDDIISALVHADALGDEEAVNMSALLLIAGLETTAYMVGLGSFALLQHPEQLAALSADEALLEPAIEELLRYLTIVQFGLTRTAREDLEICGHRIRSGDTVIASLAAANRDPGAFPDPDRLQVARAEIPHLAFGYGVHQCLGAQLARAEMKIAFGSLFRRLPGLRLAVPAEQVAMGDDKVFYGVHELPVAWD
jgi:cytochrome P450